MPRDDAKGDDLKANYVFILQIFTDSTMADNGKKIVEWKIASFPNPAA